MMELHCGDAIEKMASLPDKSVSAIITDPPYGITAAKWDSLVDWSSFWTHAERICTGSVVVFTSQPFTIPLIASNIGNFRYWWVWKKNFSTNFHHAKRMPLRNTEEICVFYKGTYNPQKTLGHKPTQSAIGSSNGALYHGESRRNYTGGNTDRYPTTVLEFNAVDPKQRLHPSQKPVKLMEYLVRTYTDVGQVVLDPFMGSASTGIACANMKRGFFGVERDFEYFELARNRFEEAAGLTPDQEI